MLVPSQFLIVVSASLFMDHKAIVGDDEKSASADLLPQRGSPKSIRHKRFVDDNVFFVTRIGAVQQLVDFERKDIARKKSAADDSVAIGTGTVRRLRRLPFRAAVGRNSPPIRGVGVAVAVGVGVGVRAFISLCISFASGI
mmetsp:Transcript_25488/g.59699  ORF Transcript_25488/g.59699 Transcript_25488/m.59699 type:complete len:141 (+) Transcript_25488:1320-1742(+)